MKKIILNSRELCDLELLLDGSFNPLRGFLVEEDYNSVLNNMRLNSGELWPIPIVLAKKNMNFVLGENIELCNSENLPIACMKLESIYKPDLDRECLSIFGCVDFNHPYIKIIKERDGLFYLGGRVSKMNGIQHYDFKNFRLSPSETKEYFLKNNWKNVIGFQTRNPMHKSHYFLTKYAMNQSGLEDIKLLIHPVVGITQDCDINYHTRVKCYKEIIKEYDSNVVKLCLLPLSMRMAGPREAVWHAIIRKNYGCTHFVVGRDHAGPSYKKADGNSFFGAYDAQELLLKFSNEIGIKVITSKLIVYATSKNKKMYVPIDSIDKDKYIINNISGTQLRRMLKNDEEIPEWYSFPNVIRQLKKDFKSSKEIGFCIYLFGLSGSGKTTTAKCLESKLLELDINRKITLLDGDVCRQELSKGLTFSKSDRSINVRRIGYVASEIVKHGGIAICSNIAPYNEDRIANREKISKYGKYIEVYMNTSLQTCESRDVKGLYKKAREGIICNFTGISDPFEESTKSEILLNGSSEILVEDNVNTIIRYLYKNLLI